MVSKLPREAVAALLSYWVGEPNIYFQNNRDWNPLEVFSKFFGEKDLTIKQKILDLAYEHQASKS